MNMNLLQFQLDVAGDHRYVFCRWDFLVFPSLLYSFNIFSLFYYVGHLSALTSQLLT